MKAWFVVYTKSLREEWAKLNLENMGYETLIKRISPSLLLRVVH